jgi:hypothetical protein
MYASEWPAKLLLNLIASLEGILLGCGIRRETANADVKSPTLYVLQVLHSHFADNLIKFNGMVVI